MKKTLLTTITLMVTVTLLTGCNVTKQVSQGQEQIDKTREVVKQIEDQGTVLP